jgi:hypothetical protein
MPRQFNRQINTIPEYESDNVPNTITTIQSNNNNNRRLASPNTTPITNTNRLLPKRPENATVPVIPKPEAFVHIPEQIPTEKNLYTGMKNYIYHKLLRLLINFRYAYIIFSTFTR